MASLSADLVRSMLTYEPATGEFTANFRRTGSKFKSGDKVGTINKLGYVVVRVENKLHLAHRLAWLYVAGEWPKAGLDHKNGNRSDNRWTNLRCASQKDNLRNTKKRSDNTSGFKGVRYRENRGHWYATIKVDGRNHYLGSFPDPEMAHAAYVQAADRYFGEFARAE